MLNEFHVTLFSNFIKHPKFRQSLFSLLGKGETSLRLKCHEILEILTNFYVNYCSSKTVYNLGPDLLRGNNKQDIIEIDYMNSERLYLTQIVVQCIKTSLEQKNDSYLQFNSLILLDFLFQNLMPVPTYDNELIKSKRVEKGEAQGYKKGDDIETMVINSHTSEVSIHT